MRDDGTPRPVAEPPAGIFANPSRVGLAILLTCWCGLATAQGFGGLGAQADGYSVPRPGVAFDFPADHGAHPGYRIEWWYVTANLEDAGGVAYGVQWTLFRSALAPPTGAGPGAQAWMGHAALTTPREHFAAERLARGGTAQAGVTAQPFDAYIDDWALRGDSLSDVRVTAAGADFAYSLEMEARGPFVPQGQDGYSVKSAAGQASYYYSQPFYDVTGTLTLPQGDVAVTGTAWLDREWSSQPLSADQTGWDWFSLHFDDGAALMGFRLRGDETYTSATWIAADGTPTPYADGAFTAQPMRLAQAGGREVPVGWRVRLPDRGVDVTVEALNDDAWMDTIFPYWEGPVAVSGTHAGRGYLEMTGYE